MLYTENKYNVKCQLYFFFLKKGQSLFMWISQVDPASSQDRFVTQQSSSKQAWKGQPHLHQGFESAMLPWQELTGKADTCV